MYSGMGGHGDVVFPKIKKDKENENIIVFLGIEKIFVGYIKTCKNLNLKYFYLNSSKKLQTFFFLLNILNIVKPRIIISHTGTVFSLLVYKFFAKKVSLLAFQHISLSIKILKHHIINLFEFIFFDKIIFLSDSYKKKIIEQYKFLNIKKKSQVIVTGLPSINISRLKKKNIKKKIIIGMSSRLVKGKKIFKLIDLMHYNKSLFNLPLHLSIVGMGDDYNKIINYIKKKDLNDDIELKLIKEEKKLNQWNSKLHIYIHFSEGETLSTSMIRALRMGIPIIASNVFGIKEMLYSKKNKCGYLVQQNNFRNILILIKNLTFNNKLYKKFCKNSSLLFEEKYNINKTYGNYLKLIKSCN
jgi:glycosyltransferase involved in cell wall biosynthesis